MISTHEAKSITTNLYRTELQTLSPDGEHQRSFARLDDVTPTRMTLSNRLPGEPGGSVGPIPVGRAAGSNGIGGAALVTVLVQGDVIVDKSSRKAANMVIT